MSLSLNKTIIAGNLTRDPETKYFANERCVVKFAIANTRKFSVNGEKREETIFLDCEAWGKLAETISKFCQKGKPVLVIGTLKQQQWADKDGNKRSKILLAVDEFQFVPDGRRTGTDAAPYTADGSTPAAPAPATSADDEPPF